MYDVFCNISNFRNISKEKSGKSHTFQNIAFIPELFLTWANKPSVLERYAAFLAFYHELFPKLAIFQAKIAPCEHHLKNH